MPPFQSYQGPGGIEAPVDFSGLSALTKMVIACPNDKIRDAAWMGSHDRGLPEARIKLGFEGRPL